MQYAYPYDDLSKHNLYWICDCNDSDSQAESSEVLHGVTFFCPAANHVLPEPSRRHA
jgi:hypothetical protein